LARIFIIAEDSEKTKKLHSELAQSGFTCVVAANKSEVSKQVSEQAPDLLMVTLNGHADNIATRELSQKIKQEKYLPIMAIVNRDILIRRDINVDIDDFIVEPHDVSELVLRIKRLLHEARRQNSEIIKCGDLVIYLAKCEVTVKGKRIELTFKEYELLKFLASNPGRVFTRDTLLNKVWGYDYYGGDRTVDVHIRRLRSKIETFDQTYIETVRNIGYRFRSDV